MRRPRRSRSPRPRTVRSTRLTTSSRRRALSRAPTTTADMRRTSLRTLLGVLLGVALVGAVFLRMLEAQGIYLPPVTWVEDVAILALAAAIFWSGWAVRAYQKGDKPDLDPLRAARTFVLAKAGALTGALLAGRYLAEVVVLVSQLGIEARRENAI